MTIYTQIDTGTVDDDGSGDTLRAAFDKVNANLLLQDVAITLDEVATPGVFTADNDIITSDNDRISADATPAAKGKIWVKDDTPNVLVFTDDTGAETVLGAGGGGSGDAIADADGDTQIQSEESADEDKIRFDVGDNITGFPAQANALILSSQEFTLALPTANVATTVGGAIALTAGAGNTTGVGGDIDLTGGTGGATSTGGTITLQGGAHGITRGGGGDVNILGGDSDSNSGGQINIISGRGDDINGSDIVITAGASSYPGADGFGGDVIITAGEGENTSTNAYGGKVQITGGAGVDNAGPGGDVIIVGGANTEQGGSEVILIGGAGGSDNKALGGAISLTGGLGGDDTSYGGAINLTGGVGSYYGGHVFLTGGNHVDDTSATYGYGGDCYIGGGDSDDGYGGGVRITGGNAGNGNYPGGNITLTMGAGSGSGSTGAIRIVQSTAPTVTTDKLYNEGGALTWNGIDLTAGGSALEVEDDGVSLSTAVTKFNFVGFNVTEPVADEIQVALGPVSAGSEYCPGYGYNFISATQFSVTGFEVTQLLSIGRRLKFIEGATLTYGQITNSLFSGGNTTITMQMEAGALTAGVTEFCLVTGATAWSPIAGDPFSGASINSIVSGTVSGTHYWVIVGDGGRIASSIDGGVTWVVATSGTAVNLYQVDYSPDGETFVCIGDAKVINRSTDGLTWVVNTSEINDILVALGGNGDGDVLAVQYAPQLGINQWILAFQITAIGQTSSAFSLDDGLTWAEGDTNLGAQNAHIRNMGYQRNVTLVGYAGITHALNEDIFILINAQDLTSVTHVNTSGQALSTAYLADAFNSVAKVIVGHEDGEIFEAIILKDDVTFGTSAIRNFAFSSTHARAVAVADDGKIGYISETALGASAVNGWTLASNNSDPTANFKSVHWSTTDGVFIAVNDVGQILRSSNGLGDPITPIVHTGFTLIAANPMAGGAINDIAVGSIGGTVYWVICGGGGQIFTSTDEGVTWTSRASGVTANLVTIGFDAAGEGFLAGGGAGEFTSTTDGTTWTGDTTTIPAIGGGGSTSIHTIVFDDTAGLWWIGFAEGATNNGTATAAPGALGTWTGRNFNAPVGNHEEWAVYNNDNTSRVYCDELDDVIVYQGSTDGTSAVVVSDANTSAVTAGHVKTGTNGNAVDIIIGTEDGDLSMAFTTIRAASFGAMTGPVRGIAFTTVNNRYIAVGDGNDIVTLASADTESANKWESVTNPFTANILAIAYNATDDIIIAVGSNGEIGRSVDGIS